MHRSIVVVYVLLLTCVSAFDWPWETSSSSSTAAASGSGGSETATSTEGGFFDNLFGGDSSSTQSSNSASPTSGSSSETTSGGSSASASSASSSSGGGGFLGFGGDKTVNPYQPIETKCPLQDLIRMASEVDERESDYIEARHELTNRALIEFLDKKANLSDFDAEKFISDSPRNISIGLAFSGGGYRAMFNGAGQMLALDSRSKPANESGLGGLLQLATYLTGLLGGNWLVGTIVLNDFMSVEDYLDGSIDVWDIENSIFNPGGINIVSTTKYYDGIYDAIEAKDDAGFDTTITDVWGRALSDDFFNGSSSGENVTWSSIRNLTSFKNHEMPFPIVVANGRTPNSFIINENSTIFEVSPYELGSWDPSLNAFTDVEFLGSFVENGTNSSQKCYRNFDNAGYIMGTSSSLFNQIVLNLGSANLPSVIEKVVKSILDRFSKTEVDIASYYPNPFSDTDFGKVKTIASNDTLYLCDGGEDGQNVPFYPLIQSARDVDLILAFDNSADTEQSWPNGTLIIDTYQRQFTPQGKGSPFPYVPDIDELSKMTDKPVFFGCSADNLTDLILYHGNKELNETDIPLVIQFWNHYYLYKSNTSTFKMSYDSDEIAGIIQNGFEATTRNNLTDDKNFAKCIGCAIVRRTQERLKQDQSDECAQCFKDYCWTGGQKDAAPMQAPSSSSSSSSSSSASSSSSSSSTKSGGGGGGSSSAGGSGSSSESKKGDAASYGLSSRLLGAAVSLLMLLA